MTSDDLDQYLRTLGYTVEVITGDDAIEYSVVRDVEITWGSLAGRRCDVGLARPAGEPYVMAAAIHTRPALVPMDTAGALKTQASPIGADWQYWSRRFDRVPAPKTIWAYVLTILGEV